MCHSGIFLTKTDLVWVPSEDGDVVPHPLERHPLVPESLVAGDDVVAQGEEAEGAEAVVERDEDDAAVHEVLRAVEVVAAVAAEVAAAVDEHHHRPQLPRQVDLSAQNWCRYCRFCF